ncbi:MAG: magnesium/cobalt transporter CorA [Anaerolineaceae bacterium]|nr:MAG: magnesium/cobalt transporter CorA [Anaerolineaceae bacterium]
MDKLFARRSAKTGLAPGALVHIGEQKMKHVRLNLIEYGRETDFSEREISSPIECFPFKDKPTISWLNVDGVHQVQVIEEIGTNLGIHPLVMEDILNTGQRPKIEDFDEYVYIALKMLYWNQDHAEIESEQVSLILGDTYVLSFQEGDEAGKDVFDTVRVRIQGGKSRIVKRGADYLIYSLMDAIVDNYFVILEHMGEQIIDLEEELVTNPKVDTLQFIHNLKRELVFLRKYVWPLREVVSRLEKRETNLFEESTIIYLRDVYDHTIQVIDTIETFREMISGMLDIYLSSVSNKMNEVMKVLTIIATVFIPLTFIAGIYGMNFAYMPELQWRFGYFVVLFIMALIFFAMIVYFRRRRWL